jgi:hypothetical protein
MFATIKSWLHYLGHVLGSIGSHEKGFGAWCEIHVFRIGQNGT